MLKMRLDEDAKSLCPTKKSKELWRLTLQERRLKNIKSIVRKLAKGVPQNLCDELRKKLKAVVGSFIQNADKLNAKEAEVIEYFGSKDTTMINDAFKLKKMPTISRCRRRGSRREKSRGRMRFRGKVWRTKGCTRTSPRKLKGSLHNPLWH